MLPGEEMEDVWEVDQNFIPSEVGYEEYSTF